VATSAGCLNALPRVRALHGEAVSTRLRKDRIYTITLRSTGELTIQPAP
jgi:hypothetical protein